MSDLIERLKEVDLGGCRLSDGDGEYLEQYVVSDIPTDVGDVSATRIIFLMESPHREEFQEKFPLAGPSGVNITRDLITHCALGKGLRNEDDGAAIGSLVKYRKVHKLSIMNVSPLPLQKDAYEGRSERSEEVQVLWCAFKEIRAEFGKRMRDGDPDLCPLSSRVHKVIENNLVRRIEEVVALCSRPPSIVTFGNVAHRSISRVMQAKRERLAGLTVCQQFPPHPSPTSDFWEKWAAEDFRHGSNRSDLVKYIDDRV